MPAGAADDPDPLPDVLDTPVSELRGRAGEPFTVDDVEGGDDAYRVAHGRPRERRRGGDRPIARLGERRAADHPQGVRRRHGARPARPRRAGVDHQPPGAQTVGGCRRDGAPDRRRQPQHPRRRTQHRARRRTARRRAQRDAGQAADVVRPEGAHRGTPPPVRFGCIARAAHTAGGHPRLRRAVRPADGAHARADRHGDAGYRHRGGSDADAWSRTCCYWPGSTRAASWHATPSTSCRSSTRRWRRCTRSTTPTRSSTSPPEQPIDVVGDGLALRQVVDNLLTNVVTHTPAGTDGDGHRGHGDSPGRRRRRDRRVDRRQRRRSGDDSPIRRPRRSTASTAPSRLDPGRVGVVSASPSSTSWCGPTTARSIW